MSTKIRINMQNTFKNEKQEREEEKKYFESHIDADLF